MAQLIVPFMVQQLICHVWRSRLNHVWPISSLPHIWHKQAAQYMAQLRMAHHGAIYVCHIWPIFWVRHVVTVRMANIWRTKNMGHMWRICLRHIWQKQGYLPYMDVESLLDEGEGRGGGAYRYRHRNYQLSTAFKEAFSLQALSLFAYLT